jgi:hypothetical protein
MKLCFARQAAADLVEIAITSKPRILKLHCASALPFLNRLNFSRSFQKLVTRNR